MRWTATWAAIAACAAACGSVADDPVDAAVSLDATPGTSSGYLGHVDVVPAVPFGHMPETCDYTMTFKQLDVALTMSGETPTAGHVQNLNVEATVGTCPYAPAPNVISTYTFDSAKPGPGGMILTFQADRTNATKASLVATLVKTTAGYTAKLAFHRTDIGTPFDWTVMTDVPLTPQ
jgi:hypothetical protein